MSENGTVYIAYQSDISELKRHSGVYSDPMAVKVILDEWKEKSDEEWEGFSLEYGQAQSDYDTFTIVAYPLDCESDGTLLYEVQGNQVRVDTLTHPATAPR